RFSGRGSGHGVGLCVIGSTHLAAAGRSAAFILQRYFPGLVIGRMGEEPGPAQPGGAIVAERAGSRSPKPASAAAPSAAAAPAGFPGSPAAVVSGDVLIALPAGDEGERAVVARLVDRARADLARTLGVPAPRVVVRVHPTGDSYEAATGRPWFTTGAVVRGEIHLLPLVVLRDRGVLERTIRQQLAHLMIDDALSARPRWVRDGAAAYFAAPPRDRPAPGGGLECPGDAELGNPVSAGSLTSALARAEACVARRLRGGRSWRDIR